MRLITSKCIDVPTLTRRHSSAQDQRHTARLRRCCCFTHSRSAASPDSPAATHRGRRPSPFKLGDLPVHRPGRASGCPGMPRAGQGNPRASSNWGDLQDWRGPRRPAKRRVLTAACAAATLAAATFLAPAVGTADAETGDYIVVLAPGADASELSGQRQGRVRRQSANGAQPSRWRPMISRACSSVSCATFRV